MLERRGRMRLHRYQATVAWARNLGTGTSGYKAYARDYEARAGAKPPIAGSSDPPSAATRALEPGGVAGRVGRRLPPALVPPPRRRERASWSRLTKTRRGGDGRDGGWRRPVSPGTLRPRITINGRRSGRRAAPPRDGHKMLHRGSVAFPVTCEPVIVREGEGVSAPA